MQRHMSLRKRPVIKQLLAALRRLVLKGTLADWAIAFLLFGVPSFFLLGAYRALLAALSKVLIPIALQPLLWAAAADNPSELTWVGVRPFVVLVEFAQVVVAVGALWLTLKFLRSLLQR